MTTHTEITTHEAAALLEVSDAELAGLLDKGAPPFHQAGHQCVVTRDDVMRLRSERAMEELARQAQELRMGYE